MTDQPTPQAWRAFDLAEVPAADRPRWRDLYARIARWARRNDLDGSHATVYADANISNARAQINSLTGFQGTGYVVIHGIGGNVVGPTDLTRRDGGMVPDDVPTARNGRLVRMAEGGAPEWVDLPGGGGFLAQQDGLYNVPSGSMVRSAPATSAAGLSVGITVNVGPFYGAHWQDRPDIAAHVRRGVQSALVATGR